MIVGGKHKRLNARFGGESAWRQHRYDDKSTVVAARRRCEQQFLTSTLCDLEHDVEEARAETNICACTGVKPVRDGVVREDGITLVYAGGRLLSAHCG